MSPSGAEYIKQVKASVQEVDPSDVKPLLAATHRNGANGIGSDDGEVGATIIDVRENAELSSGKLPGAKAIPRGFLESRIEATVPDHAQKVVLYCASGARIRTRRQHARA